MARYRFVTLFSLDAPAEAVWDAAVDPTVWLGGFPDVEAVERRAGGHLDPIGGRFGVTHRAPGLGYRLRYEVETLAARRPEHVAWKITGDVAGTGRWDVSDLDDITDVRFVWEVRTTRWWMNAAAPLARPLFIREYRRSIAHGLHALAEHLGANVSRLRTGEGKRLPTATALRTAAGLLVLGVLAGRRR